MKRFLVIAVVFLLIVGSLFLYIKIDSARPKNFRVVFFNVGQGDSALINFDNGEKMLVDCGPDRSVLNKLGEALPFYDRRIDYLLITHPDNDHYGGCVEVLRRYDVKEVIMNDTEKNADPYWRVWQDYLAREKAVNKKIVQEEIMKIGGASLKFFFPGADFKPRNDNDRSLVFKLVFGGQKIFFAGDAEIPLEEALIDKYCGNDLEAVAIPPFQGGTQRGLPSAEEGEPPLNPSLVRRGGECPALSAEYLKSGHHGSDTSSGENFLRAVSPETVIISVGKNSFGHPSFRVLKRMERVGLEVWRTDEKGDIIIW